MSSQIVSESKSRVKEMTQEEYNRIRRMVFGKIPRQWCDREDALQYGMMAACQSFRGVCNAQLAAFVLASAFHYAWKQHYRKSGRFSRPFTDLQQPDQDYDEVVDDLACTNDDLSGFEGLDSDLVERIRESLMDGCNWFILKGKVGKSAARSERAIQILDFLAQNVEQDAGVGVDEYVGRPTHPRYRRTGFRKERARVRQKLMQQFGLPFQKFDEVLSGLRKTTDQVIRERGI